MTRHWNFLICSDII